MNNGTILVVDDSLDILTLLSDVLRSDGYRVLPANSGKLALAAVATTLPDLIILDIIMPEMDGFEVLRLLKSHDEHRNIPVIIMSGLTEKEKRIRALKLGAIDFILKPISQLDELLAKVRVHVDLAQARTLLQQQATELQRAKETAESNLGSQQRLLAGIVASSEDAIISTDMDDIVTTWNHSAENIFGYPIEEIVGRSILAMIPSELHGEEEIVVDTIRRGESVRLYETVRQRKDGNRIDVSLSASPIRVADGRIIGVSKIVRDITQRKQAERALRDSEEQFRTLAAIAPAGIYVTDAKGDCLYANPRWCEMAGMEQQDALGQGWVQGLHPEDRASVFANWKQMVESEGTWGMEYRFQTPDKRITWVYARATPQRDDAGKIVKYIGINLDITERKRAEDALIESDKRFRTLFDSSPDPIWIIDEHRFTECNQAAVDMLGYSDKASLLNTHPSQLSPEFQPDGESSYGKAERMMTIAQNKGLNRFEWVHRRKDQSDFFAEVTLSIITLQGRPVLYCLWRDITERKQAEDATNASEQRFRDIANVSADWIWEVDSTARYTYVSEGVRSLLGYAPDEIIGKTPFDFMSPEEADRVAAVFAAIAQRNFPFRDLENKMIDASGRVHDTLTSGVPILDASGACIGYRGVDRDITENKRLEAELIREARVDYLTGLNNRRCFLERAEEEFKRAARYGQVLSVGMMDIDNFKKINDQHGHKTGDAVLKALAEVCGQNLRDVDIIGRMGGEEFAILMPETDCEGALDVLERLRVALASAEVPLEPGAAPLRFTVSIGVATKRSVDDRPEALLNLADEALYRAKGSGKNRVCTACDVTAPKET